MQHVPELVGNKINIRASLVGQLMRLMRSRYSKSITTNKSMWQENQMHAECLIQVFIHCSRPNFRPSTLCKPIVNIIYH